MTTPTDPPPQTTMRIVSLAVLTVLILMLAATMYQVIAPFLMPLFLAAVLAIVSQPLHARVLRDVGQRNGLAAGITTGLLVGMLMLPLLVMTILSAGELLQLTSRLEDQNWVKTQKMVWQRVVSPVLHQLGPYLPALPDSETLAADASAPANEDEPVPSDEKPMASAEPASSVEPPTPDALIAEAERQNAEQEREIEQLRLQVLRSTRSLAQSIGAKTFQIASSTVGVFLSLLVASGMFLVALYYFLADGPKLLAASRELIPMQAQHQRELGEKFAVVVRAVVLATFMAAFAQGLLTAVALQVVGAGHFLVFLMLATVSALVPLAGTWLVWGPVAVWLAVQGNYGAAIGLTLFGIVVVGMVDNVVRTYILNSDAQLHPLLAFVSVLGALQVMGLWGVFIGPIVASCLSALLQIFNSELQELAKQRTKPAVDGATVAVSRPIADGAGEAGETVVTVQVALPVGNEDRSECR